MIKAHWRHLTVNQTLISYLLRQWILLRHQFKSRKILHILFTSPIENEEQGDYLSAMHKHETTKEPTNCRRTESNKSSP